MRVVNYMIDLMAWHTSLRLLILRACSSPKVSCPRRVCTHRQPPRPATSRARDHAPKLICLSDGAGLLLTEGEGHRCGVAVRLCVNKSSDFVGGGRNFPADVGQLVVAAATRQTRCKTPTQVHSQFHNPLFLGQFLLERPGDALAPLAQVSAAAL